MYDNLESFVMGFLSPEQKELIKREIERRRTLLGKRLEAIDERKAARLSRSPRTPKASDAPAVRVERTPRSPKRRTTSVTPPLSGALSTVLNHMTPEQRATVLARLATSATPNTTNSPTEAKE